MQTLFYGGDILTMAAPLCAEALLVSDGKITAVGEFETVCAKAAKAARRIDLKGATLLPAFIDAHSHFSGVANAALQIPLDTAGSFTEIQDTISAHLAKRHPAAGEWVMARGYDHNFLKEKTHPDRRILDAVCPANPMVIQHQSGHMGVFNTMALEALGLPLQTPQQAGEGVGIQDGRLTGYMEEEAFITYLQQIPGPDIQSLLHAYDAAQKKYASYGIATVQEGKLIGQMAPLYQALMDKKQLILDVVGFADFQTRMQIRSFFGEHIRRYINRFKLGGYKIFLDGSPQGRTAWMQTPYAGNGEERGYPAMTDEAVYTAVTAAVQDNMQLLAHCNGDAAAQQYIEAVQKAEQAGMPADRIRPVMIHAQLLRPDQLPMTAACGILPSFFVDHVYYWGDIHMQNFGLQRAAMISPAGSALRQGIRFTLHQDAPVCEPDMLHTVWCAANRQTRSGICLGRQEQIPVLEALKAVTIYAAYQYFEEAEKGSLTEGKRADLAILDQNPLKVPKDAVKDIKVLATIKDGQSIYIR